MKKYLLIFSFLCFLSLPVVAEKKNNSTTNRQDLKQKLNEMINEAYFQGQYSGSLMSVCQIYLLGYINDKTKIDSIEFYRKALYENTINPKEYELETIISIISSLVDAWSSISTNQ